MNASAIARVREIAQRASKLVTRPENSFVCASWPGVNAAFQDVADLSDRIENGDLEALDELAVLFAPTGALQEVSLVSGWHDEFLALARDFDHAVRYLRPSGLTRLLRWGRRD